MIISQATLDMWRADAQQLEINVHSLGDAIEYDIKRDALVTLQRHLTPEGRVQSPAYLKRWSALRDDLNGITRNVTLRVPDYVVALIHYDYMPLAGREGDNVQLPALMPAFRPVDTPDFLSVETLDYTEEVQRVIASKPSLSGAANAAAIAAINAARDKREERIRELERRTHAVTPAVWLTFVLVAITTALNIFNFFH